MGAALDILRHAAATLATEANGVSDNPLICTDPPEALSGGNFHGEPVAFAADIIALALCEIGAIAERRIAMLIDPALSRLPAFLTPKPGLEFGVHGAAGHRRRTGRREPPTRHAGKRRFDSDIRQPGRSRVDVGARRAPAACRWRTTTAAVIGIELLAAAQGCDFHAPLKSSAMLEKVRALVRAEVPHLEEDREMAPGHRQGDCAGALRSPGRGGATRLVCPTSRSHRRRCTDQPG